MIPPIFLLVSFLFLGTEIESYVYDTCLHEGVKPEIALSILHMENPDQDPYATHNNANGTIDVGLFQLNDRYLYTDFVPNYWDKDEEFNAFNWQHNAYIAIKHIKWLEKQANGVDKIIFMGYTGGIGRAVAGCPTEHMKWYAKRAEWYKEVYDGKVTVSWKRVQPRTP